MNISILILDNIEENKRYIINILKFSVKTLNSTQIIVKSYKERLDVKGYDAIILDFTDSVSDGCYAVSEIRKSSINIPIIALIKENNRFDIEPYLGVCITDIITEPITSENFYTLVINNIKKSRVYKSIFNFDRIFSIFKNNMNHYVFLVNTFFNTYKDIKVDNLNKDLIHKLKGSSGNLGLKQVFDQSTILYKDTKSQKNRNNLITSLNNTEEYFKKLFVEESIYDNCKIDDLINFLKNNSL